jgi:hypothetical protein
LDTALWSAGDVADTALIGLLIYRHYWRSFPVFFLYIVQAVIGDVGAAIILHIDRPGYATWYLAVTIVDSVLLFGVVVEIAWSILRPLRASLSRRALIPLIVLIVAVAAAVWPFSALPALTGASQQRDLIAHLQQTVSITLIIFFLALIACSQLLSISGRDREVQIATGLGFFSFVSIATAFLEMHGTSWVQYQHLLRIEIGASVCTSLYWIVCFAQKEAERRAFTPEMQRLLLAVAGAAHSTRVALTEPQTGQTRNHDRR